MKKVLFYSLDGYSTIDESTSFIFGGIEKEIMFHAKFMADKSQSHVLMVTKDHKRTKTRFNGVDILQNPVYKGEGYWQYRRNFIGRLRERFLKPSEISSVDFYSQIEFDVAFLMGIQTGMDDLVEFCRANGKRLVFKFAHDSELEDKKLDGTPASGEVRSQIERVLSVADRVLCQTPDQMELLRRNFGVQGILNLNPIDTKILFDLHEKKYDLFWVGRSTQFKRAELFIELCKKLPNVKACMVLNKLDVEYWSELTQRVPSNLQVVERLSASEIEAYFAASKLFISTSHSEGFANTYLQAAKHAVPVVSMCCDPNQMLTAHKAGVLTGDSMDALERAVVDLLDNPERRNAIGEKAREYVVNFHNTEVVSRQLMDILFNRQKE